MTLAFFDQISIIKIYKNSQTSNEFAKWPVLYCALVWYSVLLIPGFWLCPCSILLASGFVRVPFQQASGIDSLHCKYSQWSPQQFSLFPLQRIQLFGSHRSISAKPSLRNPGGWEFTLRNNSTLIVPPQLTTIGFTALVYSY